MTLQFDDPRTAPPLARDYHAQARARRDKWFPRRKAVAGPAEGAGAASALSELSEAVLPVIEPLTAQFAAAHEILRQITGTRIKDVQKIVAARFGVTVADLVGPRRNKEFCEPRMVAMYLARVVCPDHSFPQIGRAFGDRDHTTALSATQRIAARMAADPAFGARVRAIRDELTGAGL